MHPRDHRPDAQSLFDPSRRRAIDAMVKFALLASPVGHGLLGAVAFAAEPDIQPVLAQVNRLMEAMAYLGEPFSDADRKALDAAANLGDATRTLAEVQRLLDPRCLLRCASIPRAASRSSAARRRRVSSNTGGARS